MKNYQRYHKIPKPDPKIASAVVEREAVILNEEDNILFENDCLLIATKPYAEGVIELKKIDSIVIFGDLALPSEFIRYTIKSGISTIFFSLNGKFLTRLDPAQTSNYQIKQFKLGTEKRFELFSSLAFQAIYNDLRYFQRTIRDKYIDSQQKNERLKEAERELKITLDNFYSIDQEKQLLGNLGRAKKIYFEALPNLIIDHGWNWDGINGNCAIASMIRFAYSYLEAIINTTIITEGLDPKIGFWHTERANGLAGDLLANFKSLAEKAVIAIINLNRVVPQDFKGNYELDSIPAIARVAIVKRLQRTLKRQIRYPYLEFKATYQQIISIQAKQYKLYLDEKIDNVFFLKIN